MLNGYWPWGRLWVDFALVAFAGSFLLGIAVLSRTAKRIEKVGPESDEGQQLLSDASSHCCASTCCFPSRSCSRWS